VAYPRAHVLSINPDEKDPPETDWGKLEEEVGSIRRALKALGFQQHAADY